MKCNNCGFECGEAFAFCPNCSAPSAQQGANPVGEKVMAALRDKLFLAICVLMTVSAFLGLTSGGIPVFPVLFSIFLWMTFSKARKNIVDTNQLKNLSGTVYAQYVVFNVTAWIIVVCGLASLFLIVPGAVDAFDLLTSYFGEFNLELLGPLALASGWLLLIVCIVLGGVFLAISFFGWRKIHRFAKSVYQSINTYSQGVQYAAAAKNWILVFGIVNAVSALAGGDFVTIISGGSQAGAAILAYLLLNKYLADNQ